MKRLPPLVAIVIASPAIAAPLPADPLDSPMWAFVADQTFGADAVVRFDPRVAVRMPDITENQRSFPVEVDARAIPDVVRMVIIADLNPIQRAVDYRLGAAEAFIATRIKLDQRTPVRGAVQLRDGTWLVGGAWVDAAGGGCSALPVSRAKGDWARHLGEVRGALWPATADAPARLRLAFRHPMDTGFVENISAYFLERVTVTASGAAIGTIALQAAVAEDPVLTIMPRLSPGSAVLVDGRDTNGIDYRGTVSTATRTASR